MDHNVLFNFRIISLLGVSREEDAAAFRASYKPCSLFFLLPGKAVRGCLSMPFFLFPCKDVLVIMKKWWCIAAPFPKDSPLYRKWWCWLWAEHGRKGSKCICKKPIISLQCHWKSFNHGPPCRLCTRGVSYIFYAPLAKKHVQIVLFEVVRLSK